MGDTSVFRSNRSRVIQKLGERPHESKIHINHTLTWALTPARACIRKHPPPIKSKSMRPYSRSLYDTASYGRQYTINSVTSHPFRQIVSTVPVQQEQQSSPVTPALLNRPPGVGSTCLGGPPGANGTSSGTTRAERRPVLQFCPTEPLPVVTRKV